MKLTTLATCLLVVYLLVDCSYAGTVTISGIQVNFVNRGSQTDFVVNWPQPPGQISTNNVWLGIGLNSQNRMDGTSVVVCQNSGGNTAVTHYLNSGFSSNYIDQSNLGVGISNPSVTTNNGNLACSFTRDNSNNVAGYFNLNTNDSPYIILAYGSQGSGRIAFHSGIGKAGNTIKFPVEAPTTVTTTTTTTTVAAVTDSNQTTDLSTSSKSTTTTTIAPAYPNVYYSFGFSNDNKMGSDDVALCKMTSSGIGSVHHYWNNGKSPRLLDSSNPSIGFTNTNVTYIDGIFTCSFTRVKTLNVANYFSLNKPYYLLTARGNLDGSGNPQYHTARQSSGSPLNFETTARDTSENSILYDSNGFSVSWSNSGSSTNFVVTTGNSTATKESPSDKKKAHGCLMVIAWMLFASTGIFIARYYKYILPSKKLCGGKIWFALHRPIMAFALLLSIIALIVILADLEWKWIETSSTLNFVHSIFGISAIGLAFLQICFSFLRCNPTHKYRFIFNWFHRIVGITTFTFAVVALFLGVVLKEMKMGSEGWGILIGWTLWIIMLPLVVEIFNVCFKGKRSDSYSIGNNGLNTASTDTNNIRGFEIIKGVLLFIHLIAVLAFTIALIYFIAKA